MAAAPNLTHYQVLQVSHKASFEELKAAYRAVALKVHPDKNAPRTEGHGSTATTERLESFIRVQQAWEVLGDPQRREAYDRYLATLAARQEVYVNETILSSDLEPSLLQDGTHALIWPCRCSGEYIVLDSDLHGCELLLPCTTCSLHIKVLPS
jgi:diphthamide biosynthesis protein 4